MLMNEYLNNREINKIETVDKNSNVQSALIHLDAKELTNIVMIKNAVESKYNNQYIQIIDKYTEP